MALDETGTRIADFELLDLDDPDQQTFQVKHSRISICNLNV